MNTNIHQENILHLSKKIILFFTLVLMTSCQEEFENNNEEKNVKLQNNYEIVNGTIKIDNVQKLKNILTSYQNDVQVQNDFNDEIRSIQDKEFKSLTPIFDENDTRAVEEFVLAKRAKTQKINSEYGITNDLSEDEEFDVEDDLIQDPSLAALLNENREIIVGDSLYKYTEHGLYFCLEKDKQKLYNYLNRLTTTSKRNNLNRRMAQLTQVDEGISFYMPGDRPFLVVPTPNIPRQDPFPALPTPKLVKSNLPISRVDQNGFFEKIFGETEVDTEDYGDGRRIKIKFWNQDYFIFSSLGCSARFQKRVKILGISGWQKSYADQIELGVNDISYEYNFNVPVYNEAKYNYENFFIEIDGVKYAGSGKQIIEFPSGAANFPFVGASPQEITVHILRQDLLTVKYDANKVYNQVVDLAVKEAFNKIKSYNPALRDVADKVEKGDQLYKVIAVNPLSNKATISTQGLKWTSNNENAITHYFDFNFLLTYKSGYDSTEDYLKGLQGSTKYTNVRADIYGAALHNNVWKGRRLVLGN